jgi:crotonobetainyl-CoA:carnitine CoA-transferase CaiB-like acyl-CoA transferase
MPSNTAALHGVTVLDFSHVMAGPFATYYLATLGARVIKIENPARGDSLRGKPKSFHAFNHGKEILALDLSTDQGRAQAWDLFASSDVMVDNMRPGVMEKFGFGQKQVRALKPSMIHCSISAYGHKGPWSKRPAYDHVIQAASGMAMMSGRPDDEPIKVGFPAIDCATGMLAALAIIAAIRRRDLTGEGESIDASMLGAAFQLMYPMTVMAMENGEAPSRKGNAGFTGSPGALTLPCRDGWIALGANTPQQLAALARVLDIEAEVLPLLGGQSRGFVQETHADSLREVLATALREHDGHDLEQRLNAANVPAAKVRDLGQATQESLANGSLDSWLAQGASPLQLPGLGFRAETLFAGQSQPPGLKQGSMPSPVHVHP